MSHSNELWGRIWRLEREFHLAALYAGIYESRGQGYEARSWERRAEQLRWKMQRLQRIATNMENR